MAATVPHKVKDLIHKYGWDIMPYLSNLGVNLLCNSQVLFVDGNNSQALDADDGEHGHLFTQPFATLDYAVGMCTANQGDVIIVAPGHTETLAGASALDIDVSGITIIGVGNGGLKPTFLLGGSAATTTVEVNGDNIRVSGLRFVGAYTGGTTVCIDIKTGSDYVTLDNLEFFETANTKEILTCITVEDGVDQLTIRDCMFRNLGGDNAAAIATEADEHDFLVIEGCTFIGGWKAAVLDLDAAAIMSPLIRDCTIVNYDATTGKAVTLDANTKAVMVNLRVASVKGNAYPVAAVTNSYQIGCAGCEPGAETVAYLGSATATSWAS